MGAEPSEISALIEREFVFVTGKGGVGKSTASALIGLAASAKGKRALIVLPGGESDSANPWGVTLRQEPTRITDNLDAVVIHPEFAMRQYLGAILRSSRMTSLLFHSKVARGLLMGIPGPSDWAILGKAWSWTRSGSFELPAKQKRYDLVILDAPASGDGSDMLRIPGVIVDLAPAARLRTDAESCLQGLRDPKKSAVVLVTLPEEVVVQETEENLHLIRSDLRLPLGPLFINQVRPVRFEPHDRALLRELPETRDRSPQKDDALLTPGERQQRCLSVGRAVAIREALQEEHLGRILGFGLPTVQIPYVEGNLNGLSALRKLQISLAQGL